MTDSLHLVGDGDDVEVVEWVERVFGISISNRETQETLTVGQLFDLIEAKCGTGATEMCLSQVAFYRLRRALRELGAASAIEPATPVSVIAAVGGGSIHRAWKQLARQSRLTLPMLETPFTGKFPKWIEWPLAVGFVVALIAGVRATRDIWSPGLTVIVGIVGVVLATVGISIVWHRVFGTVPRRILTIGDLAREAAGHSFRDLSQKWSVSYADRWSALLAILRNISGHKLEITRDTTFFAR